MGDFRAWIMHRSLALIAAALCLAVPCVAYNETLPVGNTTVVAVKSMPYGIHIFAVSSSGFVVHQVVQPIEGMPSTTDIGSWQLMPNAHQGSTPATDAQTYDSDPIVGQNDDGRLEVLIRSHISLDYWHYYQTDAKDPMSWVGPREPACLCNFPPCDGQVRCGNNANCGNDGYDCSAAGFENEGAKWWNTQAVFPTSNGAFMNENGTLKLFYRGFDGLMYSVQQTIPGNSTKYSPPIAWGTLLE